MKTINTTGKSRDELSDLLNSCTLALEKEKRFHVILDNMKEGVQLLDFDWRYIYMNNTVVEQSMYSREELLGFKITERYPGIDKTEMFHVLKQCMEERISKNIENEFTYPDKSTAWFKLSIQPVPEGLFILSMDITERKKTEREKEKHIKEIEQLLFKISHQVRQPVCHILGIANLLDQSLISIEELNKLTLMMTDSVKMLDVYTRDLTSFVADMSMNAGNNLPYQLKPEEN